MYADARRGEGSMSKKLTVKQIDTDKLDAATTALKLLKLSQRKVEKSGCVGRSRSVKCITDPQKCYLCDETRCLENAHIIPVAIYADAEQEGGRPPFVDEVMKLCPTHHKCYDKFKLNKEEKDLMIESLKDYGVLELILKNTEVIPGASQRALLKLDRSLETAWLWWREYRNVY
jgi:hypothetical protein